MKKLLTAGVCLVILDLAGCAGLSPSYQKPDVQLVKLQPLPGQGLEQRFAVGLRVLNPNDRPLEIKGLYYSLRLQGQKVVSGVRADLPAIPAYGEKVVELEASSSLIGSLRAVAAWLKDPTRPIQYELETRLDTGAWRLPVTVTEKGEISAGGEVR